MPITDRFRLLWTPLVRKEKGQWMQAVAVVCPIALGSGGELTLQVGQTRYTARKIDLLSYDNQFGTYLWLIPRPTRAVRCRATWRTTLRTTHRDTLLLEPAKLKQVHVIFKTHLDLGYTHRLKQVLELYRTDLMDTLLAHCDATANRPAGKRFVWTMPSWLVERCLDRSVTRERRRRLEHYIRQGQVVWHMMPFTTHSEFFGLEELCRSLYPARRLAERFGVPVPTAVKMTDVPAHTATLGMAIASAGGRFLQVGGNGNSIPPDVPAMFWWKLPDQQRLLCHWRAEYGSPLLPSADWPYAHWLSVQMTSDNVGPQSLDVFREMDWLERHFEAPRFSVGRLEDFADTVIREHGRQLPIVNKEFTDWWVYGIASQAGHTARARRNKELLPAAETLNTLADLAHAKTPSPNTAIETGYRNLALYTEHTWGDHASDATQALDQGNRYQSDLFANPEKRVAPVDRWAASWADKAAFSIAADRATTQALSVGVKRLSQAVASRRNETAIVVFNALSWARGGPVCLRDRGLPRSAFTLIDASTGGIIPHHRQAGRIEFWMPAVPAGGFATVRIRPGQQESSPIAQPEWSPRDRALHTNTCTLQFSEAGGLSRWHDRQHSMQWVDDTAAFGLGSYLYEMPGHDRIAEFARAVHTNAWGDVEGYYHHWQYSNMNELGPVTPAKPNITVEMTPVCTHIHLDAAVPTQHVPGRRWGNARRCLTTFTLYHGQHALHMRMRLQGKQATYAAEAGYAFFPLSVEHPWILVDHIAHLLLPSQELAGRVNAAHMAIGRGVRVEDDHVGMNVYPLDSPMLSIARPGAYLFDDEGEFENAAIYSMLFNNCWATNFAQWQGGDFDYGFVLAPTGNDDWDGGLARGGAEVFRPLMAAVVPQVPRQPSASFVKVEPARVQLVTLKNADDGEGFILRLWNSDPDPVDACVQVSASSSKICSRECDLLERPAGPTAIWKDGTLRVKLRGNQIKTLRLSKP